MEGRLFKPGNPQYRMVNGYGRWHNTTPLAPDLAIRTLLQQMATQITVTWANHVCLVSFWHILAARCCITTKVARVINQFAVPT